ncbi:MAG TPA: dTMP kinase, partial [Sphingomonas sp.]|nr:dTMP kinase [Sphingomonas sp.]
GAEAIRKLLLEGTADRWTAGAEALLFAAARADHVAKTILPALDAGRWVVTDRFLDSSLAYQGGAGGLPVERLRVLHEVGSHGLLPDRTLLLTLPTEEAARRAEVRDGGDSDRIGGRDPAYHARVSQNFVLLAEQEPKRFRTIDAMGAAEAVTARLLAAVDDL